jgi:hypothetical protein
MTGYKYYLISSLPELRWGEPPPLSIDSFLEISRKWITTREAKILEGLVMNPEECAVSPSKLVREWADWEFALRNRMVRIRGSVLKTNASAYYRNADKTFFMFNEQEHDLSSIFSMHNPADKERRLDALRWARLDAMEFDHWFDFEKLCIYKMKLALCEKWIARNKDKGMVQFDSILDRIEII